MGLYGSKVDHFTVSWVVTVRVMLPLFASTVIEYVPDAVVDAAVTVKTDVPEVLIELGLSVDVSPFTSDTPSTVRVAVPVKFSGVTVKLKVALFPLLTDWEALSMVSQKSVPTGDRLHAVATPDCGLLNVEVASVRVNSFQAIKSSLVPAFGSGTTYGVVEFEAFHRVLPEDANVVWKLIQSTASR